MGPHKERETMTRVAFEPKTFGVDHGCSPIEPQGQNGSFDGIEASNEGMRMKRWPWSNDNWKMQLLEG